MPHTKSANQHFRTITRRIMFLGDRIARYNAEGKPVPTFDIQEREALIWAVDKIKQMAQRLLDGGQAPDLNNTVEKLQERIEELKADNMALERSSQTYRKRLQRKRVVS